MERIIGTTLLPEKQPTHIDFFQLAETGERKAREAAVICSANSVAEGGATLRGSAERYNDTYAVDC